MDVVPYAFGVRCRGRFTYYVIRHGTDYIYRSASMAKDMKCEISESLLDVDEQTQHLSRQIQKEYPIGQFVSKWLALNVRGKVCVVGVSNRSGRDDFDEPLPIFATVACRLLGSNILSLGVTCVPTSYPNKLFVPGEIQAMILDNYKRSDLWDEAIIDGLASLACTSTYFRTFVKTRLRYVKCYLDPDRTVRPGEVSVSSLKRILKNPHTANLVHSLRIDGRLSRRPKRENILTGVVDCLTTADSLEILR